MLKRFKEAIGNFRVQVISYSRVGIPYEHVFEDFVPENIENQLRDLQSKWPENIEVLSKIVDEAIERPVEERNKMVEEFAAPKRRLSISLNDGLDAEKIVEFYRLHVYVNSMNDGNLRSFQTALNNLIGRDQSSKK